MALAMGLGVISAGMAGAQDVFKADLAHAHVGFEVSHMVISKVKGHFKDFDSTVTLDEAGQLSSVTAVIKVESIDTAQEKRDEHLRGTDFFDATQYPEIRFESDGVEEEFLLGKLTLHGVTKDVKLPYTLKGPINDPWGKTKLGLELEGTLDRTDYGLTWSKMMEAGGLVVGNEVTLSISVEFEKQE
jgi:polyisoprenoid-binding protein YceI